jgi:hypothetical protein
LFAPDKVIKVTGEEGYVAIDKLGGDAVKLVDRMEFSYNNFSPDILKGWDKPNEELMMAKPLRFKDFTVANYTQSGDDEQDYEAQKRKRHIPTGNTGEALDFTARQKKSRQMKKYKARIALGRKKAARRIASQEVLKKEQERQQETCS